MGDKPDGWQDLADALRGAGRGQTEPSADMRQWAHILREQYLAYTAEGFTPVQAMQLVTAVVTATFMKGDGT